MMRTIIEEIEHHVFFSGRNLWSKLFYLFPWKKVTLFLFCSAYWLFSHRIFFVSNESYEISSALSRFCASNGILMHITYSQKCRTIFNLVSVPYDTFYPFDLWTEFCCSKSSRTDLYSHDSTRKLVYLISKDKKSHYLTASQLNLQGSFASF